MKDPKSTFYSKPISSLAFPKLSTSLIPSDAASLDSNNEVGKQMQLMRISTLLHLKEYPTLLTAEFKEYFSFILPYINVSIMAEDSDEFEINKFLVDINKLIDLYGSFEDEDFYDQHMAILIKKMRKSESQIIDYYAGIADGIGFPVRAVWSTHQLQLIDKFLYFIAKFTYANKIN
ncbi:MAG: hypothetical protein ACRCZE_00920 [Candidatus Altimarinota bacterium]